MGKFVFFVALAGAILTAGCGSGSSSAASPEAAAAVAAAEVAGPSLVSSDDPLTSEVLDVASGTSTTLEAAVDGDRPVLLWFWAPH